jgi:hypothetical protein
MRMQILKRAALFSAAAMAIGAAPMLSQTVSYTTAGVFTGTGCAGATCTEGTFTLSFVGNVGPNAYLGGSQIDLGSFQVQCNNAPASCPMTAIPGGTTFTLTITQTSPSGGSGSFTGSVSGQVAFNPDFSSLIWTPTTSTLPIGQVTYHLTVDNTGNIGIPGPTLTSQNPNVTQVKGTVDVTPEPSTVAFMATGLIGLVPLARRRRR